MSEPFVINGVQIGPGETRDIDIFVAKQYDFTDLDMPVRVIRGREDGPRLFVCAAIHGDEVIGVEIIRRLISHKYLRKLKGTLIAVPIVNVFGFNNLTRYLPDRRDLNRSFPGSPNGSLAARLAHIFVEEIMGNATHGIDIHTGSRHRTNLPQVRACLQDKYITALAKEFDVPVILDADIIDGSLREVSVKHNVPLLVFEAGEALRYDEVAIRSGLAGILAVMRRLEMIPPVTAKTKRVDPIIAKDRYWIRADQSGILIIKKRLGSIVNEGDVLGRISDPLGNHNIEIRAERSGLIIGYSQLPLVNRGDAIFHIATFAKQSSVEKSLTDFDDKFDYEER